MSKILVYFGPELSTSIFKLLNLSMFLNNKLSQVDTAAYIAAQIAGAAAAVLFVKNTKK